MREYPEVIDEKILQANAHIADDDILRDIRVTEREISAEQKKANHDHMDAAQRGVQERKDFVEFLQKLLEARKNIAK